ncbi:MAG: PHP domain-containing protein, partial [Terriglobales bacterium]
MRYVELHARSAFSFLDGASLPETLVSVCAQQELPGMALLDRNGVYGSPRFHLAAKRIGIKAHVGSEISLSEGNCPLLVKSRVGYQNLCRLITTVKLRTPKHEIPNFILNELEAHAEGLIGLTGDENGPLAGALRAGGRAAARGLLQR